MTNDTFKALVEAPVLHIEKVMDSTKSSTEYDKLFLEKMQVKSAIARTMRLTLQYPEFAKEYLESLPKATMDNIPTATKNENKKV